MFKKRLLLFIFIVSIAAFFYASSAGLQKGSESGLLSIYFMEEKVGYEEFTWEYDENGFLLSVKGRMTKPIPIEIDELTIRMDRSFIPTQYSFKGTLSGMAQEISCAIIDGRVESVTRVAGQENKRTIKIKRDAFLLPNPVFSPYLVLTKKFRCTLTEKIALSAYIIPQLESSFTLEPKEEAPCSLLMQLSGIRIELETDEEGNLKTLFIPSQRVKIVRNRT